LDLRQRSLSPCLVSQLWPHSLVAHRDALGSRFHFGLALGLAAVLALALFGVAVGATLFGRSRQCIGHSSPPWIRNWTCSSACSCLADGDLCIGLDCCCVARATATGVYGMTVVGLVIEVLDPSRAPVRRELCTPTTHNSWKSLCSFF
jgi:hypothetical protein